MHCYNRKGYFLKYNYGYKNHPHSCCRGSLMTKITTKEILLIGIILLCILSIELFVRHGVLDDSCIIFQYAKNISTGHGWTFNPGMTINGCTSVLYPLILACFGVWGLDIASVGLWLT